MGRKGNPVDVSAADNAMHKTQQPSSSSWLRSSAMTTKSKSSGEEPKVVPHVPDEQWPEPEKAQTEAETAFIKVDDCVAGDA